MVDFLYSSCTFCRTPLRHFWITHTRHENFSRTAEEFRLLICHDFGWELWREHLGDEVQQCHCYHHQFPPKRGLSFRETRFQMLYYVLVCSTVSEYCSTVVLCRRALHHHRVKHILCTPPPFSYVSMALAPRKSSVYRSYACKWQMNSLTTPVGPAASRRCIGRSHIICLIQYFECAMKIWRDACYISRSQHIIHWYIYIYCEFEWLLKCS